jgi:hypothetical protein
VQLMNRQPTGKHQHIVPQQIIRNFAGADGKLSGMTKPELHIGNRRRAPKGILFRDDFYRDSVSDFDAELLRPVEDKFAAVYPHVLSGTSLDGHQGAALVDWVAAMLVRTQLVANFIPDVPPGFPEPLASNLDNLVKLRRNTMRTEWFETLRDLITRASWNWRIRHFKSPELVLTDNPVCLIKRATLVVVPMASNLVLIGGRTDSLDAMRDSRAFELNFFLAAFAERFIFAADIAILERTRELFETRSPYAESMRIEARKPFFGALERARRTAIERPDGLDVKQAIQNHIASFGPPVWEVETTVPPPH